MNKLILMLAAILALSAPLTVTAAGQGGHGGSHDHGSHQSDVAHEEVVDGVKATFKIMSMKEHLKEMKMEVPKGMKETHHIAVEFKDAKTGKTLAEGEAKIKVQNPDKSSQNKDLVSMQGHFGGDFDLSKKGKYGVMSKFKLKDGKVRSAKFWYTVK